MSETLHPSTLTTNELFALAERVLPVISAAAGEDPFMLRAKAALEDEVDQVGKALRRDMSSDFTSQMANEDEIQDKAFIGFRDYAVTMTSHPDPAVVAAAQAVETAIRRRGWTLYSAGYAEETTQLTLLIEDLEKPALVEALKIIKASFWVKNLKEAHETFKGTYQKKLADDAAVDYPTLKTVRPLLTRHLTGIIDYMNLTGDFFPERFSEAMARINEAITDTMAIARARRTRAKNQAEERAGSPHE